MLIILSCVNSLVNFNTCVFQMPIGHLRKKLILVPPPLPSLVNTHLKIDPAETELDLLMKAVDF